MRFTSGVLFTSVVALFFAGPALASVEVFKLPQNTLISDPPFQTEEGFASTPYGAKVWGLVLKLKNAEQVNGKIRLKGGDIFVSEGKTVYVVGAPESFVLSATGSPLYRIKWKPEKVGPQYEGCESKHLQMSLAGSSDQNAAGFPIGLSCDLSQGPPKFIVSVPTGVSWEDYTFEELEGKGERWRLFALPSASLVDRDAGYFEFANAGRKTRVPIRLSSLKFGDATSQGKKVIAIDKTIGVEMVSSSLSIATGSFSSSTFAVMLDADTERLGRGFRLGFTSRFPLGISDSPALLVSQIGALKAGWYSGDLNEGDRFAWGILGLYQAVNFSQQENSFALQSSLAGAGLKAGFRFGSNRIDAKLQMNSLGSKIFKTYNDIGLSYARALELFGIPGRLGLSYRMTDISATADSGAERKITESAFTVFVTL